MKQPGPDKRKKKRTKAGAPRSLEISCDDNSGSAHWMTAKLVDSSETGLGIEIPSPLAVGSQIDVRGNVKSGGRSKQFEFRGHVRWCLARLDGAFRAGLSLEGPVDEDFFAQRKTPPPSQLSSSFDYYDVLQISPNAEPETIHRVYRLLAQRYHPDNVETGNEEMFRVITEAYDVLSDPETRAAYDVQRDTGERVRWKIFDRREAAVGVEAEKRKRQGILSLLYARRINEPEAPTLTIREFEDLLGCPREHLEVSLWYLRKKGWVECGDNARYSITVEGFDQAEERGTWGPGKRRLLTSAADSASAESVVQ